MSDEKKLYELLDKTEEPKERFFGIQIHPLTIIFSIFITLVFSFGISTQCDNKNSFFHSPTCEVSTNEINS